MADMGAGATPKGRMVSIDALRGFVMFWIIGGGDIVQELVRLVHNPLPYAVDKHFEHAKWIGIHGWDLIMPLFLFITGASLPFAMSRRIFERSDRRGIYLKILKRFVILFVLGMAVQGNLLEFDISKLDLYCNTLQAIACGYVVAAVALLNMRIAWQALLSLALLAGYWLLMMVVPVPGHGAGVIRPDANLALYIDEMILGRFRDGTAYTWILSSMTFSSTVLLGVMSGHILKSGLTPRRKLLALAGAGGLGIAAGEVVAIWFPVIKYIWSSSFTLLAAGFSFLLMAFFYGVIDVLGARRWSFFFVVIGSNALFVYCFTSFANEYVGKLVQWVYENIGMALAAPIALGSFALLWLLLYTAYRKQILIKV